MTNKVSHTVIPASLSQLQQNPEISQDLMHLPKIIDLQAGTENYLSRFVQILEISQEKPGTYQRAMANIFAAAQNQTKTAIVYLIRGNQDRVSLYMGVAAEAVNKGHIHEAQKNLEAAIKGHMPGVKLEAGQPKDISSFKRFGAVIGIPTPLEDAEKNDDDDFQGIERLIKAMQSSGNEWQIVFTARPLSRDIIQTEVDKAMRLASHAASWSKATIQNGTNTGSQSTFGTNKGVSESTNDSKTIQRGKNEGASDSKGRGTSSAPSSLSNSSSNTSQSKSYGTSESNSTTTGSGASTSFGESQSTTKSSGENQGVNLELHDKWNQSLQKHLDENIIRRLQKGINKGLFECACYIAASDRSTYDLLAAEVQCTFQGDAENPTPLVIRELSTQPASMNVLFGLPSEANSLPTDKALIHSIHLQSRVDRYTMATMLTVDEIALMASLPRREVPGIVRRKSVDFALSLPEQTDPESCITLGKLVDRGSIIDIDVALSTRDMDKHVFITGVTGAGKTTTCLKLLLESGLPFLVLEPAKTEYRALFNHLPKEDIDCYRVGLDPYHTLRINPFQLVHPKQKLSGQISLIKSTLAAVFPMEASMPQLVEEAIMAAYEARGWDISSGKNWEIEDPWELSARAWPTFSDMIRQLDIIIPKQKMGRDFEEKYRGSLVSRLNALTRGDMGQILDAPYSVEFRQIIGRKVIIELDALTNPEDKAFLMALILGRMGEAIKDHKRTHPNFRHLTLIEEAHRLLAKPEPGENNKKNAVEVFANMLAEVRKYGEGLIVADQIPNKLISDVLKNTHTKIVHRLYAEDDRRAVGDAMMLSDEQKDFLPDLRTGEAVVFTGGWHGAARVQIKESVATDDKDLTESELDELSAELLWRQRKILYPKLSAIWIGVDAMNFADFCREAKDFLNLLLKLLQESKEANTRIEGLSRQIINRYCQWQKLGFSDTKLLTSLVAILRDGKPRLKPEAEKRNAVEAWTENNTDLMASFLDYLFAWFQTETTSFTVWLDDLGRKDRLVLRLKDQCIDYCNL